MVKSKLLRFSRKFFTSDTWAYSEGGVITTAGDLANWIAHYILIRFFKKSSLDQLWNPAKVSGGVNGIIGDNGAGKPNYYGLGWFTPTHHNVRGAVLRVTASPAWLKSIINVP